MSDLRLDISNLTEAYRAGSLKPTDIVRAIYARIASTSQYPVWISLVPEETALARARELESDPHSLSLSLYGIPFAVKDNIDAAGMPTTAGCPEYSYTPECSATVIDRLITAGAILIGKTNLDQFATGLVGTRSPYGACSSVYDERYISGGSSSGSAVAVAKNIVSFSLGTDTAGSGRVPAAFNNLVGLKPTRGVLSTSGVVPACRTLDCVSVFASTCTDAETVWNAAKGWDTTDPFSRAPQTGEDAAPWISSAAFRFGCPPPEQWEFFGDDAARQLFEEAIDKLQNLGGERVTIDFTPFRATADLLYSGPWIAERLAAIEEFISTHEDAVHPVVRKLISGGAKYSAVDTFRAMYQLEKLRRATNEAWDQMDILVLPTTGTTYTLEQVAADPIQLNTNLGYYTNFVNLLDLAAVAIPAGFRPNGLPFGISLIGCAFSERALLQLGNRFLGYKDSVLAHISHTPSTESGADSQPAASRLIGTHGFIEIYKKHGLESSGCISVAVVGAHLQGQPLNRELTSRGARLVKTCKTSPQYRLYALRNTTPPKPGLVRDESYQGPGIELEVWAIPENEFGSFVAGIPAPLGIGNATLEDGSSVKCFICEPYAITGSEEITHHEGWRNYLLATAAK